MSACCVRCRHGTAFAVVLRVVMSTAIWLLLQYLLLSRRVQLRRLLPGSVVAGVGGALLNLYSAVWMPRVIESNADRYGIIGITFALLTWLILVCVCVVVAAVIGAEMGGAPEHPGRRWSAALFVRAAEVPGQPDDDAL
nr:hypothetical protein GCM10020092_064290 [Actinoplanes digitatis]